MAKGHPTPAPPAYIFIRYVPAGKLEGLELKFAPQALLSTGPQFVLWVNRRGECGLHPRNREGMVRKRGDYALVSLLNRYTLKHTVPQPQ